MARILLIDDSSEYSLFIESILNDHQLTIVDTLSDAYKVLQTGRESFDLVLLDVFLPDGNGIKSISQIKNYFNNATIPVLMLTNDDDIVSKVAALGLGADDYILKPTDAEEIKARIGARLRISNIFQRQADRTTFGDLTINSDRMQVLHIQKDGRNLAIDLTPLEFKILRLLTGRPGQVYSRDQLIDHVWGIGQYISERSVDAHVSHLRKKIKSSKVEIATVVSLGYRAILKDA